MAKQQTGPKFRLRIWHCLLALLLLVLLMPERAFFQIIFAILVVVAFAISPLAPVANAFQDHTALGLPKSVRASEFLGSYHYNPALSGSCSIRIYELNPAFEQRIKKDGIRVLDNAGQRGSNERNSSIELWRPTPIPEYLGRAEEWTCPASGKPSKFDPEFDQLLGEVAQASAHPNSLYFKSKSGAVTLVMPERGIVAQHHWAID